uniref:Uncharacterized protein n=1 Tax=Rhizophora mucronata TaxID=61149 RepID=A0A2P2QJ91_RHIMU
MCHDVSTAAHMAFIFVLLKSHLLFPKVYQVMKRKIQVYHKLYSSHIIYLPQH